MYYQFDPIEMARQLLPLIYRRKRLFALLKSFLQPLRDVTDLFDSFRESSRQKLMINGQVIYIEHVLNSYYYFKNREIYIEDTPGVSSNFIDADGYDTMHVYDQTDNDVTYLYAEGEGKPDGDYIVNIPDIVEYDIEHIKSVLEINRPAGKQFKINVYQYIYG